jgi:hypothetical protein
MSSDVFLLGAGFSKAVSDEMLLLDELGRVSYHLSGEWPRGLLRSMNFEELLTYLSQNQPWLPDTANLHNRATFMELSQGIAARLMVQEGKALSATLPDWLASFVTRLHEDQAVVISLNYDTLIEHAWTERLRERDPKLEVVGSHAPVYGVPIPSALGRTQWSGEDAGKDR